MLRAREKVIFPASSTLPVAPPLEIASFEMVKENEERSEHPVVSTHWICQLPSVANLKILATVSMDAAYLEPDIRLHAPSVWRRAQKM